MIVLQVQISEEEITAIVTNAVRDAMPKELKASTPLPHIKGIHELAAFLKVSASRAQKLKNEGVFPYFQDGRLVLFDPDKVREAMEAHNKRRLK